MIHESTMSLQRCERACSLGFEALWGSLILPVMKPVLFLALKEILIARCQKL